MKGKHNGAQNKFRKSFRFKAKAPFLHEEHELNLFEIRSESERSTEKRGKSEFVEAFIAHKILLFKSERSV